jgi:hypothetical protein
MAILSQELLTLSDWAKGIDPNGEPALITELLAQKNPIMNDVVFIEGNLPTGHRNSVRTGLPESFWRRANKGVPNSKSTLAQIDESFGVIENRSQIDVLIADLGGNPNGVRFNESKAHFESISQEFTSTLFYGNSSISPEEFNGLSVRYSSLSAPNAQNIVSGGGTGSDNSSIWLIVWGEDTVSGIFPKGGKVGLLHKNIGEGDAFDEDQRRFRAYMDLYQMTAGLNLKDWRFAVRIPNIDISNLVNKVSAADLIELMIKATHRIYSLETGKAVFYMNRSCFQMLDIQRRDDIIAGGGLTYDMVDGKRIASFRGIPVRPCDALVETEALVA